ncbi:MAG TPA: PDZ domain-containing protein, partial [Gemmataceae bacterium]|nr:PDZ domain-containing protein [Gemmataceae bacterium]
MSHHPNSNLRAAGRLALTVVLLGCLTLPARTETPDSKSREQTIADIEKEIKDLQAKLDAMKTSQAAQLTVSPDGSIPQSWVSALSWRSIGPATMGGRITAISVFDADPTTYWIASASGGLLKTINNGITFEHQFDKESTVSIGDVCVAPSDRNVVWVGTGEGNPRNSVSYGDGVYKSTDGGKTWTNMGLRESFQIGRIVIHPTDPNTVYVGALGRLYGPNTERGVFKTTDGGKTWERVLYVDDKTGCIDMRMNPADPNMLVAALWERKRDEFDSFLGDAKPPDGTDTYGPSVNHGKGGGLFRTTDAGKTWKKIDKGVPTVATGRIGVDWYRKDPKVVFAIIDSEKVGTGLPPPAVPYFGIQGEDAPGGVKLTEIIQNGPAAKAGLKVDDVITAIDGKPAENYEKMLEVVQARKVGDKVQFTVKRGDKTEEITVTLEARPTTGPGSIAGGGGGGGGRGGRGGRGGFAALAADQPWPGFVARDTEDGIRVRVVNEDSSAAKAGIKADDMVLDVDGKKVGTFAGLLETLKAKKIGDKVTLTIQRGPEKKSVEVALEQFRPPAGMFGGGGGGLGGATPGRPYGSSLGGQVENRQTVQGPEGSQTG